MDLEGITKKILSTDKILGIIWFVSWVLAIWIFHLQFFLTGLFCLFLIYIILGRFDKKEEKKVPKPPALFSMDKNTKTLTVQKLFKNDLKWEEHEICSGTAELPSGPVKEGDVVTNCKGNLAIRHIPSNKLVGGFDFEN